MRHPGLDPPCFRQLILLNFVIHPIVSVHLWLLQENTANHVACEYWKLQSKITAPADLVCGNRTFCFVDGAFKFVLEMVEVEGAGLMFEYSTGFHTQDPNISQRSCH